MYGLVERVMGIEPTFSAWEADVLPLNYTRSEIIVPSDFHHALRWLGAGIAKNPRF